METQKEIAAKYGLTHTVISDTDGRYEVKLYRRGRCCGGASGHQTASECLQAAYEFFADRQEAY